MNWMGRIRSEICFSVCAHTSVCVCVCVPTRAKLSLHNYLNEDLASTWLVNAPAETVCKWPNWDLVMKPQGAVCLPSIQYDVCNPAAIGRTT